jgi:hypothetical protein
MTELLIKKYGKTFKDFMKKYGKTIEKEGEDIVSEIFYTNVMSLISPLFVKDGVFKDIEDLRLEKIDDQLIVAIENALTSMGIREGYFKPKSKIRPARDLYEYFNDVYWEHKNKD